MCKCFICMVGKNEIIVYLADDVSVEQFARLVDYDHVYLKDGKLTAGAKVLAWFREASTLCGLVSRESKPREAPLINCW